MTYENVNISAIDKFKALWRRYRAKKTIHETRREFENLFYEIQKEREYEIQWRYEGLCAHKPSYRHWISYSRSF